MLNAEKYKDQLLKFVEENHDSLFGLDKNSEPISCTVSRCNNCQFGFEKNNYIEGYSCSAAKIKWLLSGECKESIKLSKLEYELLRHLYKKDYRYIVREKSERMFAYKGRPFKVFGHSWNMEHGEKLGFLNLYDFSYLFQFVNWEDEQPTSIKEVLENCEVVEDAEE